MAENKTPTNRKDAVINNADDQLDQDTDGTWRRAGGGPDARDADTASERAMRQDEVRPPGQAPDPAGDDASPGPSTGSVDVVHGQVRNEPGDTAPRREGGQGPDQPRSLGSAGGGATGPGSSTIHDPPER